MYSSWRKILSQNFFHDRKLVKQLLRKSSIGQNDIVLEIGPGKGIITEQLFYICKKVIAVELDTQLYLHLQNEFKAYSSKLNFINKDFLKYNLPPYSFKVFANIPFSIEGKIIRKLLNADNPPVDCYLVMRKDLAERLSGKKEEGLFSILYKPWFDLEIIHTFSKYDYIPAARMDTVLLRIRKKELSLINFREKRKYDTFIGQGFGGGKNLKYNLQTFLSYEQLKRLSKQYNFDKNSSPSKLSLQQWVAIFTFIRSTGKI